MEIKIDSSDEFCLVSSQQNVLKRAGVNEQTRPKHADLLEIQRQRLSQITTAPRPASSAPRPASSAPRAAPRSAPVPSQIEIVKSRKTLPPAPTKKFRAGAPLGPTNLIVSSASAFDGGSEALPARLTLAEMPTGLVSYGYVIGESLSVPASSSSVLNVAISNAVSSGILQPTPTQVVIGYGGIYAVTLYATYAASVANVLFTVEVLQNGASSANPVVFLGLGQTGVPTTNFCVTSNVEYVAGDVITLSITNQNAGPDGTITVNPICYSLKKLD